MKLYNNSKRFWILISVFFVFIAVIAWGAILSHKQQRDIAATRNYVKRVQPQLDADPRFKNVRLTDYSCDYIMHPYLPLMGSVESQRDLEALDIFIRASKPPIFVTMEVAVGTNYAPVDAK